MLILNKAQVTNKSIYFITLQTINKIISIIIITIIITTTITTTVLGCKVADAKSYHKYKILLSMYPHHKTPLMHLNPFTGYYIKKYTIFKKIILQMPKLFW